MTIKEKEQAIDRLLRDNWIIGEIIGSTKTVGGAVVTVNLPWGDWKHVHLRTEKLIEKELGGTYFGKTVTETDGSDCYSAIHAYLFTDIKEEEA